MTKGKERPWAFSERNDWTDFSFKEKLDNENNEIADITKIINVSVICLCKIKEKGIIHM